MKRKRRNQEKTHQGNGKIFTMGHVRSKKRKSPWEQEGIMEEGTLPQFSQGKTKKIKNPAQSASGKRFNTKERALTRALRIKKANQGGKRKERGRGGGERASKFISKNKRIRIKRIER